MTAAPLQTSVKSFGNYVKSNGKILALYAVIFLSVCMAPSFSKTGAVASLFDRILTWSLSIHANNNLFTVFLFSFASSITVLLPLYLSGLSVCGIVLSPILLFMYGFSLTAFSSRCYLHYGTAGLLLFLAVYLLPSLVSSMAALLSSREAFVFSHIIGCAFSAHKEPVNFHDDFRLYCFRQLLILILDMGSAVLSVILHLLFFRLFHLS